MKKALIILTVLCLLLCAACGPETPSESASAGTTTGTTPTEQAGFAWEGKYAPLNGQKAEITLSADSTDASARNVTFTAAEEATLTLNEAARDEFNYYTIVFKSTQPLWMYVGYEKDGELYEELCFLEAGEDAHTFNSYIDGFMDKASAANLKSFRFSNRGEEPAQVEIVSLATAKKDYVEKDVFLQNDYIKIGADLVYGGGLAYLEYIKEPVALVTKGGRAEVGIGYADLADAEEILSTSVNLFNNYDTGRLVQQSYYGTNRPPYECGEFSGMSWCYNPVMGGDRGGYSSKIIDFELTDTHIYVKCRPMDWGKENEPTLSYMESTYTLDGRNLMVDNRFVDFSPYTHVKMNQELPALYVIEPLYRLAYYKGSNAWTGGDLTFEDDLPFWNGIWPTFRSKENWWAWVNGDDDGFGIGLYVPNVTQVTGGIFNHNKNVGSDPSKASPTSYIAPLRQMTIVNFKPLEYSYAISCGRLSEIRASIQALSEAGTLDNTSLKTYNNRK